MNRVLPYSIFFVILAYCLCWSTIINIPADYPAIQQGINVSVNGDTVLVQPGTYMENINFNGHNIVVGSLFLTTGDTGYISQTIIDGDYDDVVVTFENDESDPCMIAGFTIQNGRLLYYDIIPVGGILCHYSNPEIRNNIIINNLGVGIACDNSSATIRDNIISYNQGMAGGGIFCIEFGEYIITNNLISNNIATGNLEIMGGGGIYGWHTSMTIGNNTIINNQAASDGGGIMLFETPDLLHHNLIAGNQAHRGGGIASFNSSGTMNNNTITGNFADLAGGVIVEDTSGISYIDFFNNILWADSALDLNYEIVSINIVLDVSYCDIGDSLWTGDGNISQDPLFVDPENGDFHLMSTACGDLYDSPCIDAGSPYYSDSLLDCSWGLGTSASDMGAYGGGDTAYVAIWNVPPGLPERFMLLQNYPNPFNSSTTIEYGLPEPGRVRIDIYDLLGRRVEILVDKYMPAGRHQIVWDASAYSSGVYFYRIEAGDFVDTKRMVYLK
jgi:parallel beta-helix repeat protein